MNEKASASQLNKSLQFLSELLHRYYQKKAIVLIDEYDTPLHAAYSCGYYRDMTNLTRSLLSAGLKDNSSLHRGYLTGIVQTSKEGIFSGLNNVSVFSLFSPDAADKFGFTEDEVETILKEAHLETSKSEIKSWYNCYRCGGITLYNPWSILNCVKAEGILKPYWVNTSDNATVMQLIARSDSEAKEELETLLNGGEIKKEIKEAFVFPDIEHDSVLLWSLLLFTGYVTYSHHEIVEGRDFCMLNIPNKEILILYGNLIRTIFNTSLTSAKSSTLLDAMISGNRDVFALLMREFIINTMSIHDIIDTEAEKSYHLFVLGMLVALSDRYEVSSNRESGYGRYDIMLTPHDLTLPGIIIEFKKAATFKEECLEAAAEEALEQIEHKQYAQTLRVKDIKQILIYGIAIKGKAVCVKFRKL